MDGYQVVDCCRVRIYLSQRQAIAGESVFFEKVILEIYPAMQQIS